MANAGGEDDFAALEAWYQNSTKEEVVAHLVALKSNIEELSMIEANARFDRGEFEVIGSGSKVSLSDWDESLIRHVRIPGSEGGAITSVTLPREEFKDLYAQHDELRWLEARLAAGTGAGRN